jgi:hypothetical protein
MGAQIRSVSGGYASFASQAATLANMSAEEFGKLPMKQQEVKVSELGQMLGFSGGRKKEEKRQAAFAARTATTWALLSPQAKSKAFLVHEFAHLERGHLTQSLHAEVTRAEAVLVFRHFAAVYAHSIILLLPDLCGERENWNLTRKAIYDALTATDGASVAHYARCTLAAVRQVSIFLSLACVQQFRGFLHLVSILFSYTDDIKYHAQSPALLSSLSAAAKRDYESFNVINHPIQPHAKWGQKHLVSVLSVATPRSLQHSPALQASWYLRYNFHVLR